MNKFTYITNAGVHTYTERERERPYMVDAAYLVFLLDNMLATSRIRILESSIAQLVYNASVNYS